MDRKYRIGILGCGRLGSIAAKAVADGKAPRCELAAVMGRDPEKTGAKAAEFGCEGFTDLKKFAESGLDYVIEASKQDAAKECIPVLLSKGISVISLSTGVFADRDFCGKAAAAAESSGARVYLATGCLGGFDLAGVLQLMDGMQGTVVQYLPPKEERKGPFGAFPEEAEMSALEGFGISPAHLNIVIASALACGSLEETRYEVRKAQPGTGSFGLEMKNSQTSAKITITQNSFELIALSTVAKLNRLTSPITF